VVKVGTFDGPRDFVSVIVEPESNNKGHSHVLRRLAWYTIEIEVAIQKHTLGADEHWRQTSTELVEATGKGDDSATTKN